MIGRNVKLFCCEDASNIENYDKAIADKENIWHCHHRLELTITGGVVDCSVQDLIGWGLYYNRPASELIFLTHSEHKGLHNKSTHFRKHNSNVQRGRRHAWKNGKERKIQCIETGIIYDSIRSTGDRHSAEVADGKLKHSHHLHYCWVEEKLK